MPTITELHHSLIAQYRWYCLTCVQKLYSVAIINSRWPELNYCINVIHLLYFNGSWSLTDITGLPHMNESRNHILFRYLQTTGLNFNWVDIICNS